MSLYKSCKFLMHISVNPTRAIRCHKITHMGDAQFADFMNTE